MNTSSWCDPGQAGRGRQAACSPRASTSSPSTRTAPRRSSRPPRRPAHGRRLPRRRLGAGPKGWVTGSEWDWGDLYNDIVDTVLAGEFTGSEYNANYRVGYKDGANPFVQSAYGPMVDDETKALIAEAPRATLDQDGLAVRRPGHGPGRHRRSRTARCPAYDEIEATHTDFFVQGVVGDIPKG